MAGLHFSPFLPPFPGVGRCKAAGADTCPYGGMDMHIVTEYLPPEMQEQLLGDPPVYPPKSAINKALENAKATAGTRMLMKFQTDAVAPRILRNYISKSVSGSRRRAKTVEGRETIKVMRALAGGKTLSYSKSYMEAHGPEEGAKRYKAFIQERRGNLEEENARKLAADEYLRRQLAPSNSRSVNEKDERDRAKIREAKEAKYKELEAEYKKRKEEGASREELNGLYREMRNLVPKKRGKEYMRDKVRGSVYLPVTSVTAKGKGGTEKVVDFQDLSETKALLEAQKANEEATVKRLQYIMSISGNPSVKNGTGIGEHIAVVHDGKLVEVQFDYNAIDTAKVDKLPKEVRDRITAPKSASITIDGWRAARDNGDITEEEFQQVTRNVSEINYLSQNLSAQAENEIGIKFTPPSANRSTNRVKDVRSTLNDACRDLATATKHFEEKTGGRTMDELEKEVRAGSTAIKGHLAKEYAPNMNVIMGTDSGDIGTNIVQSSRQQAAPKSVQQKVLGSRLDTLMRTYGTRSAAYDYKLMEQEFSPEELADLTYTKASISVSPHKKNKDKDEAEKK